MHAVFSVTEFIRAPSRGGSFADKPVKEPPRLDVRVNYHCVTGLRGRLVADEAAGLVTGSRCSSRRI
jgi:hypothetical protein